MNASRRPVPIAATATLATACLLSVVLGCRPAAEEEGPAKKPAAVKRTPPDDPDGDGWASSNTNRRITLRLVGIESTRSGNLGVGVDEVRFPLSDASLTATVRVEPGKTLAVDWPVSARTLGVWAGDPSEQQRSWKTNVTISRSSLSSATGSAAVAWTARAEKKSVTVRLGDKDSVRLDFRTTVETFADPDPNHRDADRDADGLLDWEEAQCARCGVDLGDPWRRDLILVVGFTNRQWEMTDQTRGLLRTAFRRRGIQLYLASKPGEGLGLAHPGLMQLNGQTLSADHAISLDEANHMRRDYVKGFLANAAHLLVLAHRVSPNPDTGWGWAEFPGATLVARSHLPMLGPDFHQYQAKDILHELGHNLGLGHPDASDARCPSGPIPESERHSASTVMGTPRSDRGDTLAMLTNAWARPMDYSPTQWRNARLDWVRPGAYKPAKKAKNPPRPSPAPTSPLPPPEPAP